MCDGKPLKGETVVFTGSAEPKEAMALAEAYGAKALYMPLIRTVMADTGNEKPDIDRYDWLIFTSAAAVEAVAHKKLALSKKVAAVGEKTAQALKQAGFPVHFVPSVFSADTFAEEFPAVAGRAKCLFIKGDLAKDTVVQMPLEVDEWTVYRTERIEENALKLQRLKGAIVVFASPSAVRAYTEAGGSWTFIRPAAIGHITEQAIKEAGGCVESVPEKYTYTSVIENLAKRS